MMAKNMNRLIKIKVEVQGSENTEIIVLKVHNNIPVHILEHARKQMSARNASIPLRHQAIRFYQTMLESSEGGKFWQYATKKVESRFRDERSEPILNYLLDKLLHFYLRAPPVVSNFDSYQRVSKDNGNSIRRSSKFRKTLTWNEVKIHRNSIGRTARLLRKLMEEAPSAISDQLRDPEFIYITALLDDLAGKAEKIEIPHKIVKSGERIISKNSSTNKIFAEEVLILFDHILGEPHYNRCRSITNLLYPESTITAEILKKSWSKIPYKRKKAHLITMAAQNKGV